jgi:RNA polymerase sigma-B factor
MAAAARTDRRSVEDVRLIRLHHRGDAGAREALIGRYLPLARGLASRYRRGAEPIDDLVQVASIGLVKAVDRWDPDRGLAFSTFAVPTILGELRRYFRDATWTVRPPRGLRELSVSVEQARQRLLAAGGREPTGTDLAQRLGLSVQAVEEALQATQGRLSSSLDSPAGVDEQDAATVGELIGDTDPGFAQVEARVTIERLMAVLDDRAREVLRLRFEHDLRQSDIAERIGCSQMHVSRIIRTSLDRLSVHSAHVSIAPAVRAIGESA